MKKKISWFNALLFTGIISISAVAYAGEDAELRKGDAYWPGGGFSKTVYNDIDIYYASSVSSNGYTTHANTAINEYSALSTSINFNKVSTNSDSQVTVWGGDYGLDYLGVMEPFKYDDRDKRVDARLTERWDKVYIKLNDEAMNHYNMTSNQRRKTTIHEFGHMFALQHQGQDVNSVMKQGIHAITKLTTLDKYNIQWKFN